MYSVVSRRKTISKAEAPMSFLSRRALFQPRFRCLPGRMAPVAANRVQCVHDKAGNRERVEGYGAFKAAGLGAGTEVICPCLGFIATAMTAVIAARKRKLRVVEGCAEDRRQ
jgi:hypothetical protein